MLSNNSKHQNCLHSNKSKITCKKNKITLMKRPHLDDVHISLIQAVIPQIFTNFLLVSESKPSGTLAKSLTSLSPKLAKL